MAAPALAQASVVYASAHAPVIESLKVAAQAVGRGRNAGARHKFAELAERVATLPFAELRKGELVSALAAFARGRAAEPHLWRPVSAFLTDGSLSEARDGRLAAIAHAYAKASVKDASVLRVVAVRAADLAEAGNLRGRQAGLLLEALGRLSGADSDAEDAVERLPEVERLLPLLEETVRLSAAELSAVDIANAFSGLGRLGQPGFVLVDAVRSTVKDLADEGLEPREATMLVGAYGKLAVRDEGALGAIVSSLRKRCNRGDLVPADFLPNLVQVLAGRLRPPPASLARVLEMSLPRAVGSFGVADLVLVVPSLAFVPGLAKGRVELRSSVFGKCLEAPLSAFRPRALVGVLRSAWALGHKDPDFWAPAFRQAESSVLGEDWGRTAWSLDDVASAALLAARVAVEAPPTKDPERGPPGPGLQAAAPAASRFLRTTVSVVAQRIEEIQPRELGLMAIAVAKLGDEDGDFFALISQRAQSLLGCPTQAFGGFNARDTAQLLAAFARFDYRDEALLEVLARHVEAGLSGDVPYDPTAKDITLQAFSQLGGVPGAHRKSALAEGLLEYELSRRKDTDRAGEHLASMEVLCADDAEAGASVVVPIEQISVAKRTPGVRGRRRLEWKAKIAPS